MRLEITVFFTMEKDWVTMWLSKEFWVFPSSSLAFLHLMYYFSVIMKPVQAIELKISLCYFMKILICTLGVLIR